MKKVLSFVLVLSMILGSFGMAFAANDIEGSEYADALTVLVGLGVIEGYADGTVKPEKVVTRAEAATLIIKAMDLQDYAVGKSAFTDMAGHWADAFVAYAVSLGFVAGNTDGTFAPDAPVTSDQMITMLVQAIGYKGEYLTGGYPGAFVNTAKALGMLEGVKSGAAGCTRGEVAQLIYNTLDVPFVSYDKDGGLQNAVQGVRDTMYDRLVDEKAVSYGAIVLGSETSKIDLKPYQGLKADIIKDDGEVVAIDNIKSVYVEGELSDDAKTFTLADDTEYKFATAVTSDAAVTYFENGVEKATASLSAVAGDSLKLAVKLDGKYIKELHSIAKWEAKKTIQWAEANIDDLKEDTPVLDTYGFEMTTNDEIDMDTVILVGVDALEDIEEDAVVTYYLDKTNKVVKVEVSTAVVEGEITKTKEDANGDVVDAYIAGTWYDVAVTNSAIDLEAEGTFFLDYAGDIFKFEGVKKAENFAMVTVANATTGAFGEADVTKIKMMTADGKEAVYTFDKDFTATPGAFKASEVAVYSLDKDGEIDSFTTKAAQSITNGEKLTAKNYLDGKKVSANVVVFEDKGDEFEVIALSEVPVNTTFAAANVSYVYDSTDKEIDVIVIKTVALDEQADDVYGVVVDSRKVKVDDKSVYEVEMLVDGQKVEYYTTGDAVTVPTASGLLQKLVFDGSKIDVFVAQAEVLTTIASITDDGNIELESAGKVTEIASDAVVYLINKDGKMEVAKFSDIREGHTAALYQLDKAADDKDGVDVIVFQK